MVEHAGLERRPLLREERLLGGAVGDVHADAETQDLEVVLGLSLRNSWRADWPAFGTAYMKIPGLAPFAPANQLPSVVFTFPCLSSSAVSSPKYQTLPLSSWV